MENNTHDIVPDIYGQALLNYLGNPSDQELIIHSDIAETEGYPISWFFRKNTEFPEIELKALDLCTGKVLDVGAGTGIHSLELQQRNFEVKAIDISEGSVQIMKEKGVSNALVQDFYSITNERYDTILMLMNGFGVMGKLDKVPQFFQHIDTLLTPNGQIIVDSSDLLHLYQEDDGSVLIDLNGAYYGEVEYQMEFEGKMGAKFDWLFIDFDSLEFAADKAGFKAVKIFEEENFQYLAKITRK